MKAIPFFYLGIIFLCSCGNEFRPDEYHLLRTSEHFSISSGVPQMLTNGYDTDTFFPVITLKARYLEHFYGGSCKGGKGYWEFERIYFAFSAADTSRVRKAVYVTQNYDDGMCGSVIPAPSNCLQWTFGYPVNEGKIAHAPVLIFNENTIFCDSLFSSLIIDSITYQQVFHYHFPSSIADWEEIFFSPTKGIVRLKRNGEVWDRLAIHASEF